MTKTLVADDDVDIRDFVTLVLGRAGHEVTAVADGAQAAQCLQTEHFDVAVLDNFMPGLSGLDVARQVHGQPTPRVLVISALPLEGQIRADDELSHVRFLAKPFDTRTLLALADGSD